MIERSCRFRRISLGAILIFAGSAYAQWSTPNVDGSIGAGEYGSNNQVGTNTAQTWYMTWDATNLYIGITNANLSEGAVVYITPNPPNPVTGGSNADGNLSGFNYDNASFSALPFRARFVTYFKDGYREYRTSNGSGGWSGATSNYGAYASNSQNGNMREVAIPWSAITGAGLPSNFVFFGYLVSSGGYVYGQTPNDNTGAFIGTSATYTQYYAVGNTGNGTSTPPFSDEQPAGFNASAKAAFKHDTFDLFYRTPAGAAPESAAVTLRFRTGHFDVDGVTVRAYLFDTATGMTTGPVDTAMSFDQNITENSTTYDVWKATLTMPTATTIYYYKFKIFKGPTTGFYSDDYLDGFDNLNKDGTGKASDGEPFNSFEIAVYDPAFQTPAWLQNANVYHIFPDRFRNGDVTNDYCRTGATTGCPIYYGSQQATAHTTWNEAICDPRNASGPCPGAFGNQFFGGDLAGIQNKLDYVQLLGVDTLYLNPIFQARSNHRYDTDNYRAVDPALGGDKAFTALTQEMDRRGMRVILDGVFNHASSDSLYFDRYHRYATDGACESLTSTWRTWFHFNDSNVPCTSADYPGWFGLDSLPTFDHSNPQVKDFFYSGADNITQHWYGLGASGWRFDVADDGNFPRSWWHAYRAFAKSYKSDGPLIGEIWPDASQWLAGDQMDSVMNYRFRKNVTGFVRGVQWCDDNDNGANCIPGLTPSQFDHALRAVRDDYPPQATAAMLNLLDSHDTNRALYVFTEKGDNGLTEAKERLKLAALFQFTYIGAPMVFYGDEVALDSPSLASGSNGPIGDPYTRAPYPWLDQAGDPGIYGPPDGEVWFFYARLAHLRKQFPVLRMGSFAPLLTGDTQQSATAPNTYAFARTLGGASALIALNNGAASNTATIPVSGLFPAGTLLQDALTLATYHVSGGSVTLTLGPRSGVLLLPFPALVDLIPPIARIQTAATASGNGSSHKNQTTLQLSAFDLGSGVSQLRYWLNSGPTTIVPGANATITITNPGQTTVYVRAVDNAGNVSPLVSQTVKIE